jgi:hypothetical protein
MKYVVLAVSVLALALVGAASGKAQSSGVTVGWLQQDTTGVVNKRIAFVGVNEHVLSTRCMKEDASNFFCVVRVWDPPAPFNEDYNVTYNASTGHIHWSGSAG